jgi:hypothetical protein
MCGNIHAEWNSTLELAGTINARHGSKYIEDHENASSGESAEGRNDRFANMTRSGHLRSVVNTERPELFNLVARFASSQCSDPRDKAYGPRAVARDGDTFPVDYSCGLFDLLISLVSCQNFNSFKRWVSTWTKSDAELMLWLGDVTSSYGRNEDRFYLNILHTGWKLIEIFAIQPNHILADIINSDQDWLVFPLSEDV